MLLRLVAIWRHVGPLVVDCWAAGAHEWRVGGLLELWRYVWARGLLTLKLAVVCSWGHTTIGRLRCEAASATVWWHELAIHVLHVLVTHVALHRLRRLSTLMHRRNSGAKRSLCLAELYFGQHQSTFVSHQQTLTWSPSPPSCPKVIPLVWFCRPAGGRPPLA